VPLAAAGVRPRAARTNTSADAADHACGRHVDG
jgi:hypothetical protein